MFAHRKTGRYWHKRLVANYSSGTAEEFHLSSIKSSRKSLLFFLQMLKSSHDKNKGHHKEIFSTNHTNKSLQINAYFLQVLI